MMITITHAEWLAELRKRGEQARQVKFVCPSCGHAQSGQDFLDLGMTPEQAASKAGFSCIGRWLPTCQEAFTGGPGPCNYAGGGLIGLNPIRVIAGEKTIAVFDFAEDPLAEVQVEGSTP